MESITADKAIQPAQQDRPTGISSKGGRKSRQRRGERRREEANRGEDKPQQMFAELMPAYSQRPGGVFVAAVGLTAFNARILARLRSVAQRPLAVLLTDANISSLKKVMNYLVFARICAAHILQPYVVGEDVSFVDEISSDQLRSIDGRCTIVINAFAWALSHLGRFADESTYSIPVVQVYSTDSPSIEGYKQGLFKDIRAYIIAHALTGDNPAATDIPEQERPSVLMLLGVYGLALSTGRTANRFSHDTYLLWNRDEDQPDITPAQWQLWQEVNAAAAEMKLTISNFKLSAATGSLAQIVRFNSYLDASTVTTYYCTKPVDAAIIRAALCLRLGIDAFAPDGPHRYKSSTLVALVSGNDTPDPFINAQLTMISKNEIR